MEHKHYTCYGDLYYEEKVDMDLSTGFHYCYCVKTDNNVKIHYHKYYELCFLPYDDCKHFANDTYTDLPQGTLMFVRPNDYHDFINEEHRKIVIICIALNHKIVDSLFDFLGITFPSEELLSAPMPPYVVLNPDKIKQLLTFCNQLCLTPANNIKEKNRILRFTLMNIFSNYFSDFTHVSNPKDNNTIPDWLHDACNEMLSITNLSAGLERMVELSAVSKEHLCRSIKKYLGLTASEYINDLRLTYIANMLMYSSETISYLCFQIGFSNLNYMYSLFQKKYGVSPAKFRKLNALTPRYTKSKPKGGGSK